MVDVKSKVYLLFLSLVAFACSDNSEVYQTETLEISQLTEKTFVHKSFLDTESYGKVSCNGMVFIDNKEAIVFDAPTGVPASKELIDWIKADGNKIIGVVATHFHEDCLGGLKAFHKANIPSYSHKLTIELAAEKEYEQPKNGFKNMIGINIGESQAVISFPGEGHTKDNIIGYIKSEETLFGGCLIKCLDAGEGYTADGNVAQWSETVASIKKKYPNLKHVIPGHGPTGGIELLDYTIKLFEGY